MYDATCDDVRGFICGDSSNAHLPASYKEFLKHWGLLIFQALNWNGILPDAAKAMLYQSNMDGYELLKQLAQKFHPNMVTNIATIIPTHQKQIDFHTYSAFQMTVIYYYLLQGWIFDDKYNFGVVKYQDTYIQNLKYSDEIQTIVKNEMNVSSWQRTKEIYWRKIFCYH